jgi:hypothetical protein
VLLVTVRYAAVQAALDDVCPDMPFETRFADASHASHEEVEAVP